MPPGVFASPPPPPPSPPPAAEVAAAVESAASQLSEILATQSSLDTSVAQQVTSFVSDLMGVQADMQRGLAATLTATQPAGTHSGGADAPDAASSRTARAQAAEDAAKSLNTAVMQLAHAVATSAGEGAEVVLTSPNLNMTTEVRSPTELAARPVQAQTSSSVPVSVQMGETVLQAAAGADPSLPVNVVLYTVPGNLHSTAMGEGGSRRRRLSAASTGEAAGAYVAADVAAADVTSAAIPLDASPTVAFSLVQRGVELRVSGAADPINVSVPYVPQRTNTSDGSRGRACAGRPTNASTSRCTSIVECRWWNATSTGGWWSTHGCVTLEASDGTFICSCDHLTDYRV